MRWQPSPILRDRHSFAIQDHVPILIQVNITIWVRRNPHTELFRVGADARQSVTSSLHRAIDCRHRFFIANRIPGRMTKFSVRFIVLSIVGSTRGNKGIDHGKPNSQRPKKRHKISDLSDRQRQSPRMPLFLEYLFERGRAAIVQESISAAHAPQ